ncbi:MAG: hypothetical protein K6F04_02640, partial [bacterium]|nr:hypothetical protein [bacterium]
MKKLNINVIFISIVAIVVSLFFALKKESKEIYVNGRCSKLVNKDKFSISISIKNLEKDSSVALSKTLSSFRYSDICLYEERVFDKATD